MSRCGSAAFLWPWLQIFLCLTEVDGTLPLWTVVLMALGPVVADSICKESACVVEVTRGHRLGDWLGCLQDRWMANTSYIMFDMYKASIEQCYELLFSSVLSGPSFTNHSHICNQGSYTHTLIGSDYNDQPSAWYERPCPRSCTCHLLPL